MIFFMQSTLQRLKFCVFGRSLLCIWLLFLTLLPVAYAMEKQPVRVGYYENDTFQAGASDDLAKTGYAYEYMQRLSMYTDWTYEYVYGEYGDLYKKLISGDIDILAGLAYRKERDGIISYPKLAMGDTPYWFLKRTADTGISSKPETIAGKRIGAVGVMKDITERYLNAHGINAEIVMYNDVKARDRALVNGDVDIIIVEGNGTGAMQGVEAFAEAGKTDYFLCVSRQRPDLITEMNSAQEEMFRDNPELKADLSRRWFRQNAVNTTLSAKESLWLKEHSTFIIGCYTNFLPFSTMDENGTVKGIVTDIVPEIFRVLKVDGINIEYKCYDSFDEMKAALERQEIHAIFPMYSCYWPAEQFNIMPTDFVLNSYFNLIYLGEYPDEESATLALVKRNAMLRAFVSEAYPKNPVVFYDTIEECLDAVANGMVDGALVSGVRTDYLLHSKENYRRLRSSQSPQDAIIGFAVRRSDAETVNILNHGIRLMDPNFAPKQIAKYAEPHRITFVEYVRENAIVFVSFIFVVAVLVVLLVMREVRMKNRQYEQEALQKLALEEKVEEISRLNTSLKDKQAQLEVNQTQLEELTAEQEEQIEEIKQLNISLETAREAAEAANQAKTTFLFNMSHDLRTPMNAIIGYRDLMEKEYMDEEKRLNYLKKMKEANATLLALINNVLDMARLEKGGIELEESVWCIEQDNDDMYSVFDDVFKQKSLTFKRIVDVEHPLVYCDVIKIRQLMLNLISNACKYTEDGGEIRMQITELPYNRAGWGLYQTIVKDNGIGISEEFMPHIFEEFAREANTTGSKVYGTGLGLPIVKKLVDFMNGTIDVTSKKGEGTSVIITLPHRLVAIQEETNTSATEAIVDKYIGKRILLAEDNEINAEITMAILSEFDFYVEHATDGKICVDMLTQAADDYYALILMDIQMPNMGGYEATKAIRTMQDEKKARIPIIALTANAFEEDKKAAFEAGMNGHVSKPIDVAALLTAISSVLGQ